MPVHNRGTKLDGLHGVHGFNTSAHGSLKKNWVIAISPAAPAQKDAYTLGEAKPVTSGQKLTFSGTVTYGGVADQFHANQDLHSLHRCTMLSTLKVIGTGCTITYSITFARGIPTKFLNLL